MLTIYDDITLDEALETLPASAIRDTLSEIVSDAKACDLWALTCVLVVQAGDHVTDLRETLGFDPLGGPLHEPGIPFEPYWSWLERHKGHYEMLITAGDEGFAYFILIPDDGPSALVALVGPDLGTLEF